MVDQQSNLATFIRCLHLFLAVALLCFAAFLAYSQCLYPFSSLEECKRMDNIGHKLFNDGMYYEPIDVVYTWVNGSDPRWKKEKQVFHKIWLGEMENLTKSSTKGRIDDASNNDALLNDASNDNRFRDNEELRYSLRSVEKYAPWVRHIYIVTDGQVPSWMDISSDKLSIVKHSEIFENTSHLPVFSSPAIECNLHRIPGLSDNFIYFNDDVFLGAPVYPEDFISPTGIQNVYLSWEVPECAPFCRTFNLGNGRCDRVCNVPECDYDLGDCGCTLMDNSNQWKCDPSFTMEKEYGAIIPDTQCSLGCKFPLIADGKCDYSCNKSACAFDAGQCGVALTPYTIPSATISQSNELLFVREDTTAMVVNITATWKSERVSQVFHSNDMLIREAIFFEEPMSVLIFFSQNSHEHKTTFGSSLVTIMGQNPAQRLDIWIEKGARQLIYDHEAVGVWKLAETETDDPQVAGEYLNLTHMDVSMGKSRHNHRLEGRFSVALHKIEDWSVPVTFSMELKSNEDPTSVKKIRLPTCIPVLGTDEEDIYDDGNGNPDGENPTRKNPTRKNSTGKNPKGNPDNLPECTVQKGFLVFHISEPFYENQQIEPKESGSTCENLALHPLRLFTVLEKHSELNNGNTLRLLGNDLEGRVCLEGNTVPKRRRSCIELSLNANNAMLTSKTVVRIQKELAHHTFEYYPTQNTTLQCIDYDRFFYLGSVCDTNHAQYDEFLKEKQAQAARNKRSGVVCHERNVLFGERNVESSILSVMYDKILAFLGVNVVEELGAEELICAEAEETVSSREKKLTKDSFGDSLRYVDKLFTRKFGKPKTSSRRRVPSHMPHMINKQKMIELRSHYKTEFDATSSHRFRHAEDMQFSFSYFYYIMNRNQFYPQSLKDIWNEYLDINHDGVLDSNEMITVASLAHGDYPPSQYVEEVKKCLDPTRKEKVVEFDTHEGTMRRVESLKPYVTLDVLEKCTEVVKKLEKNVRKPKTHTLMTEEEVTFHMLSDNYGTAWNQLQSIRARRTKFVCINDDMKFPSNQVGHALHEFFVSMWPRRSQFELPFHLRNKYGHIDEYYRAEQKQVAINITAFIFLIVFGALLIWLINTMMQEESNECSAAENTTTNTMDPTLKTTSNPTNSTEKTTGNGSSNRKRKTNKKSN